MASSSTGTAKSSRWLATSPIENCACSRSNQTRSCAARRSNTTTPPGASKSRKSPCATPKKRQPTSVLADAGARTGTAGVEPQVFLKGEVDNGRDGTGALGKAVNGRNGWDITPGGRSGTTAGT